MIPLLDEGWTVLAVATPHHARVAQVLGPPDVSGSDGAAWDLTALATAGASLKPPRADTDMLVEE